MIGHQYCSQTNRYSKSTPVRHVTSFTEKVMNDKIMNQIIEFTNKGYGNVMVWAGIIDNRKTALVRINGRLTKDNYCEDILTNNVIPLCRQRREAFMHDNAPPNKAHVTSNFLVKHDGNVVVVVCGPLFEVVLVSANLPLMSRSNQRR